MLGTFPVNWSKDVSLRLLQDEQEKLLKWLNCCHDVFTSVLKANPFHMLTCLRRSTFPIRPPEGFCVHLSEKGKRSETCGFRSCQLCVRVSLMNSWEAARPHTVTEANYSLQNFCVCFITSNAVSSTLTQPGCDPSSLHPSAPVISSNQESFSEWCSDVLPLWSSVSRSLTTQTKPQWHSLNLQCGTSIATFWQPE